MTDALGEASRVTAAPYNADYHVILTDLYGLDGLEPQGSTAPCAGGNCTNWVQMVTNAVTQFKDAGLDQVAFDITNEPNGKYGGTNSAQYQLIWNSAYGAIRSTWPAAPIVGPSHSQFNATDIAQFLDNTKAAGTIPNELCWHAFGAAEDPVSEATTVNALLAARSITGVTLTINEYLSGSQQTPAYTAWYLARSPNLR